MARLLGARDSFGRQADFRHDPPVITGAGLALNQAMAP